MHPHSDYKHRTLRLHAALIYKLQLVPYRAGMLFDLLKLSDSIYPPIDAASYMEVPAKHSNYINNVWRSHAFCMTCKSPVDAPHIIPTCNSCADRPELSNLKPHVDWLSFVTYLNGMGLDNLTVLVDTWAEIREQQGILEVKQHGF